MLLIKVVKDVSRASGITLAQLLLLSIESQSPRDTLSVAKLPIL